MKKPTISEILSAIVFLPPAKKPLLKIIRKIAKSCFNFVGKVLGIFL